MNPRRKKKWLQSSERKDKKEGELDFFFFFFLHGERSLDLDISLNVQIESALESIQDYSAQNLNIPNNFWKNGQFYFPAFEFTENWSLSLQKDR